MRIVAISDTHGRHKEVNIPECDLLICAGDYTGRGMPHEVSSFLSWIDKQRAHYKIVVQGNHEMGVEKNFTYFEAMAKSLAPGTHFIEEGPIEIEGIKIWCSAITPWFYDWAYNRLRNEDIKKHWDKIPEDTNILITHGPPYDILDETVRHTHVGCTFLVDRINQVKPDIHIFGHIHHCGGQEMHINGTSYYNVAVCDEMYQATNGVRVIDYELN